MIKRVFWVALFTGSSHLISILTISYIIRELGEDISGYVGIIDSTVVMIATIISFGIQLAVNRNVATKTSWKSNYHLAQSARLMLSFFVLLFGAFLYLFNGELQYLIYAFAPLAALNGDYALYGNGKPIAAASLSFLRVAAPNIGILIAGYFGSPDVLYIYIILLALGIFLAGLLSARFNQVSYLHKPIKNFTKFYYKYWKVGGYQVASALIVPGILVIADWFYELLVIGLINGLLKILIVYKGGLRIIVQAFFKELRSEKTGFSIDKASLLIWGFASIPVMIYYKTTTSLLFADKLNDIILMMPFLGIIMFIASFRNSSEIRALLKKKDNLNFSVFIIALAVQIIVLVTMSYSSYYWWGIPCALLSAELIVVIGLGYGLGKFNYYAKRLKFTLRFLPPILLALVLKILVGESLPLLLVSLVIYVLWALVFFKKVIFGKVTE